MSPRRNSPSSRDPSPRTPRRPTRAPRTARRIKARPAKPPAADSPAARPLVSLAREALSGRFEAALADKDGVAGAHCVHELWMRGGLPATIERALELLWASAADSVPEWLPMRYIHWLPAVYEIALRFTA